MFSTVHPFFTKDNIKNNKSSGSFRWLPPLGKNKTCLHGLNLEPKSASKVAAFDLDGTIIKFKKQTSVSSNGEWEWWNSVVPAKLRDVAGEGYVLPT